jgi:hypothetical protein
MSLDYTAFSAVMSGMKKAAAKKLPEHLFSEQATDGQATDTGPDYLADYNMSYGKGGK